VLMLTVQYRMHPNIRVFPSDYFYHGKLVDGEGFRPLVINVQDYVGFKPVSFLDMKKSCEEKHSTSYVNEVEARYIVRLILLLREFISINDMSVIAPYKAQVSRIKSLFKKQSPPLEVEVSRYIHICIHRCHN
jgi:superfamily I DNA and/or RNA helicase